MRVVKCCLLDDFSQKVVPAATQRAKESWFWKENFFGLNFLRCTQGAYCITYVTSDHWWVPQPGFTCLGRQGSHPASQNKGLGQGKLP